MDRETSLKRAIDVWMAEYKTTRNKAAADEAVALALIRGEVQPLSMDDFVQEVVDKCLELENRRPKLVEVPHVGHP